MNSYSYQEIIREEMDDEKVSTFESYNTDGFSNDTVVEPEYYFMTVTYTSDDAIYHGDTAEEEEDSEEEEGDSEEEEGDSEEEEGDSEEEEGDSEEEEDSKEEEGEDLETGTSMVSHIINLLMIGMAYFLLSYANHPDA
jgi:hypothetical protein